MTIRSPTGLHIASRIPGAAGLAFDPLLGPVGHDLRRSFFLSNDVADQLGPYDSYMYSFADFGFGATRTRAFVDNEMEVLSLTTLATANDGGYDAHAATFGMDFDDGTLLVMRARLVTDAVSQRVAFGLTTARDDVPATAAGGGQKATFVARTAASANWRVATDDGTTDSEADYSPVVALVAGTWQTFMVWRTSTEVRFRIGANAPMARTANLPDKNLAHFPAWGVRTLTAVAREVQVSYYALYRMGMNR